MSEFLNDEQYSKAREALIAAGYSQNGADAELSSHQDKYRSKTDSAIKHVNDANVGQLATEAGIGALATYGAAKAGKSIYDRMFRAPQAVEQVEPTLDTSKPLNGRVGDDPILYDDGLLADQQAKKAIKQAEMTSKEVTSTQAPNNGVEPTKDIGKGIKPEGQKLVAKSEQNKELKAAAKEVGADDVRQFTRDAKGNIQWPEKMSPSGRAGAEAFMQQYPELAKQLEAKGQFAILGAGSGDNSLYNTYGAQTRKDIIQDVNQGKLVGTHGGNEGFYNKTLTPAIAAVPPTTPLGAELARLRIEEPKGGVHGPLGTSVAVKDGGLIKGKNIIGGALKAGAPAALLMAISNAANASTQAQESSVGKPVPPPSSEGAFVGYPQLMAQGKKMQKAGEGRIPENIADPSTYGFVRGLITGDTESSGMSVLSPKNKKAKEAAYYGGQLNNFLQMMAK
jgi:hypothetical protein